MAFTAPQLATLADAINRVVNRQALETELDPTEVIPELATLAVAVGFSATTGLFFESVRNRPFSTLIAFVAFAGGGPALVGF